MLHIHGDTKQAIAEELSNLADGIVWQKAKIFQELRDGGLGFGLIWYDYWRSKMSARDVEEQESVDLLAMRAGLGQGLVHADEWRALVLGARAKAKASGRAIDAAVDPHNRLLQMRSTAEIKRDNAILSEKFRRELRRAVGAHEGSLYEKDQLPKAPVRTVLSILQREFPNMKRDVHIAGRAELCVSAAVQSELTAAVCVDTATLRRQSVHASPVMRLYARDGESWNIHVANIEGALSFLGGYRTAAELELILKCNCWVIRRVLPMIVAGVQKGLNRTIGEP